MRIMIDGDATPGIRLIENVAKQYKLEVYIFCDFTHILSSDYSHIITVDQGYQSVDMKIMEWLEPKDIVITQDYGLASLVLSKGVVMDPKGRQYTNDNIDYLLSMRHLQSQMKHRKGPRKRTCEDDEALVYTLERIIKEELC